MIQRLKEIRKVLGYNQTDFAKHLGITQTAYSMIENGNRPLADKYIKVICSSFNVNESWLTQQYLLLMAKELLHTQEKLLHPDKK